MPVPRLLHPVPVELKQVELSKTLMDEEAREPVQHAARSTIFKLQGQVRWTRVKSLNVEAGGVVNGADGYVLFSYADLSKAGVVLNINDQFTKIGGLVTNVYITMLEPLGHYPNLGGPGLVKAYFRDRDPTKAV
jgi:hypothetical protein